VVEGLDIFIELNNALVDGDDPDHLIDLAQKLESILNQLLIWRRKGNSRRMLGYLVIQTPEFRDALCLLQASRLDETEKDLLALFLAKGEHYDVQHHVQRKHEGARNS